MAELGRVFKSEDTLCVLDIGATSASNIRFFTERGHRIYSQDLLEASIDPALTTRDEQGQSVIDSKKFLEDNLNYPNSHFDVVFCWNLPDYMDESLVKPVVARLWSVMKPGGMLLVFFHTREAGPDAPYYRYHITGTDVPRDACSTPSETTRKSGPRGQPRASPCSGSSTTGILKICFAISPRSSSFCRETTFAKYWSCDSGSCGLECSVSRCGDRGFRFHCRAGFGEGLHPVSPRSFGPIQRSIGLLQQLLRQENFSPAGSHPYADGHGNGAVVGHHRFLGHM